MTESIERSRRKHLVGVVSSVSGEKTIKVVYDYKTPHPKYQKEVKRKTVLHAHDENKVCKIGDRVEIMETRPLSRMKRWSVTRVVEAAPVLGA